MLRYTLSRARRNFVFSGDGKSSSAHSITAGFTLVEVLVVMAVIAILVALLLPVVAASRATARQAQCQSNMRQIWLAFDPAGSKNQLAGLDPKDLQMKLAPLLDNNDSVWICPADPGVAVAYGANSRIRRIGGLDAGHIVLLDYRKSVADVVGHPLNDNWSDEVAPRHGGVNALMGGGHVGSFDPDQIDPNFCPQQLEFWIPERDKMYITAGTECETNF